MTKYRIAIQKIEGTKFKHEHNIMFETNKINKCIQNIRLLLKKEIEKNIDNACKHFNKKSLAQNIIRNVDDDLIDWNSKGKDITKEEFLENEMFFGRNE